MNDTINATMTLDQVSSGITASFGGRAGTTNFGSAVSATSGYAIQHKENDDGVKYDIVSVVSDPDVEEPASVIVVVTYDQTAAFDEVDLEARYYSIPGDTSLAVDSTVPAFAIRKQVLPDESGLVSSIDTNVDPFTATLTLKLWFTNPDDLNRKSKVTLDMVSIEGGGGGPVQKKTLAKIELVLA